MNCTAIKNLMRLELSISFIYLHVKFREGNRVYNPNVWGTIGPTLITNVLQQRCGLNGTYYNSETCSEMTIYPARMFYPFTWSRYRTTGRQ